MQFTSILTFAGVALAAILGVSAEEQKQEAVCACFAPRFIR